MVEVARTAADRVDRQTVAGRLGQHERQGQHKSAAIEDPGMIAYTKEVVVKRPVVYVSKNDAEFVRHDLPCHFVLEQVLPVLAPVLALALRLLG